MANAGFLAGPLVFLSVRVLSRLFRRLFLEMVKKAFDSGKLRFFAALESYRERQTFVAFLNRMKACEWVVYAKRPFAGPQQVLDYVGRYTHRVAISNNRLLDIEDGQIRFQWKDYRDSAQVKTMNLSADEFIRRFLLHVLPQGFRRIRYYGFLGNRYRKQKLDHCRRLLGMPTPLDPTKPAEKDYRDQFEELTGDSLHQCPQCKQGRMLVVEIFPPARGNSALLIDSS